MMLSYIYLCHVVCQIWRYQNSVKYEINIEIPLPSVGVSVTDVVNYQDVSVQGHVAFATNRINLPRIYIW